jgi:hypothetical protein
VASGVLWTNITELLHKDQGSWIDSQVPNDFVFNEKSEKSQVLLAEVTFPSATDGGRESQAGECRAMPVFKLMPNFHKSSCCITSKQILRISRPYAFSLITKRSLYTMTLWS